MHRFVAAVLRLVVALVSGWWARFCLRFRSPSTICTVTIGPGKLRGVTVTAKGIRYHYFKGIRYAEPPIGDLRFKPPVPLKTFAQPVVDCFVEGSRCLQYDQILKVLIGSEDGLFLNVYTPELPGDGSRRGQPINLPVLVYIHGGGFTCGSGDAFLYDPVYFVQRRVVIVTFNYRLGPLGFLSFPEAGVAGNAGLKDQLLVLRWVREHISAFGGNPDNVTLVGESAGAKSAYLHYLSPVSRQYFHRVICQSGVVCSDFALQVEPTLKARKLAACVGFRGSSDVKALESLMNAPAKQLIKHQLQTLHESERYQELQFPFRPVVEANEPGAIVTQHPQDALRSVLLPPIPIITGCNSAEGIMAYANAKNHLNEYNDQPERLLPPWLLLPSTIRTEVALKVKGFYFGDEPVSRRTVVQLLDLLSDNEYVTATLTAAELMARHQPLVPHYAYYFTFDGRFGNLKQLLNLSHLRGVSHGDDVFYMFHSALNATLEQDADEHRVRDALVTMWTNFARHGNPTPAETDKNHVTWEPVEPCDGNDFRFRCLQIDRTLKMISNPTEKRSQFWRMLIHRYGDGSRGFSS
uniref:Carboxylic ester hydrolase n=1 Tax=Anopheles braziliensis TaxID=58242 RepID=A0A2M3YZD4_9DIPT